MKHFVSASILMLVSLLLATDGLGDVYRVGPKERYKKISQVASLLKPGDTVELIADITDSFELTGHGTKNDPITIKGVTRTANGRIERPRINLSTDTTVGIYCKGDWNVLEGLDITGARGDSKLAATAIYQRCSNLTIRNCCIHHNGIGVYGDYLDSGDIFVEFCEFDSNGGSFGGRSLYINAFKPGSLAIVQFCYFHDATSGVMLKSSYPRNVIRYNWFENSFNNMVVLINNERTNSPEYVGKSAEQWYPGHSDIVGNVFFTGWSPGPHWAILSLGGEGAPTDGTEGDFNIAHNLFATTSNGTEPGVGILVHGNVERVNVYNNIFLPYGTRSITVYQRGTVWDTPRTKAFLARRGGGDPIIEGSHNWISQKARGIPESFSGSIGGLNPRFVDLVNGDFHPAVGSPLVGQGLAPLPRGRIVDIVPEYEPQKGISPDLMPVPRRGTRLPSVGPFEVPLAEPEQKR